MGSANPHMDTGFRLRGDALFAYGCGHGCRVGARGEGHPAELIAIGRQWARVRIASGRPGPKPGETIWLEPGLKPGHDLPRDIPGRVAGRRDDELWVAFATPLAVPLLDLQSSLESCAAASPVALQNR